MKHLPVDDVLAEVRAGVEARGGVVLLSAPTGSGKTTRVPPALADPERHGEVWVLEPRRLAARAAARRVSAERGSELGGYCGYQVRDDTKAGPATRVRYVTEGVLVRRCLRDPFLEGIHTVVFDEFHERNLDGDLGLAMVQEVRETVRPELRLVVMSATLDIDPLVACFPDAQRVDAQGRSFPVETEWLGSEPGRSLEQRVASAVRRALVEGDGDVLVFLPGVGEIARCGRAMQGLARERDLDLVELHGRLDGDRQDRALQDGARRRVVLSTNVAESSVTVPGVRAVVDTGLARVLRHDPNRGIDTLALEQISLANAEQRAGRAGRTAPGRCYRLWSRADERRMPGHVEPEIRRVDLAGAALAVHSFGGRPAHAFGWFERPSDEALARAESLLGWLDAVGEDGAVTETGRAMLAMALPPRLARLVTAGRELGCARGAAAVASLVAEVDGGRLPRAVTEDLAGNAVEWAWAWLADPRSAGLDRAVGQAVRRAFRAVATGAEGADRDPAALGRAVLAAFPDRVARRRDNGVEATMVGGRGLAFEQPIDTELFCAVQLLDVGRAQRTRVGLWAPVDEAWLDPARISAQVEASWDGKAGRVVGRRTRRWGDLVLAEGRGGEVPAELVAACVAPIIERDPWRWIGAREGVEQVVHRIRWIAARRPDLEYPVVDDAMVAAAAAAMVGANGDLRPLAKADIGGALLAELADGGAALHRFAPSHIDLPSGRRARIDYGREAGPTVSALIQEWYGRAEGPRLDGAPVVLEFLGPNRRPVQISSDLAGFWQRHYPALRKELGRRYPKHHWPEDPLSAQPSARGLKPRRG